MFAVSLRRNVRLPRPLITILLLVLLVATLPVSGQPGNPDGASRQASGVGAVDNDIEAARDVSPTSAPPKEGDEFASILIALVIILLAAKIGGDLCERVHQPAVLGELILGVVLGNMYLLGFHGFEHIKHHLSIEILAEIGVIVLLFEVGLESNLQDMLKVGVVSLVVAVIGVIAPFGMGYAVAALLLPHPSVYSSLFVGACLAATSVGITARVFRDMGRLKDRESMIVLGAAVIDDVLGLLVLSIVSSICIAAGTNAGGPSTWKILWIVIEAFIFLVGSIVVGGLVVPRLFRVVGKMKGSDLLVTFSLMFCFVLAYIAKLINLAPIVGAFAAGIILEEVHYRDLTARGERKLDELLRPIAAFLVPVFFVHMGMRVDLSSFAHTEMLGFAALLTLVAIAGKQLCSLGAIFEKNINKFLIGLGMIPRGEVGLIVANIGRKITIGGEPVIDTYTFSAVVIMVILTTLVTPPVLRTVLARRRS